MIDAFDNLYVVSDLHLGGRQDAAVFDSSAQLAALIRWAALRAQDSRTAFVIAGDIVDFLAFPGAAYFNGATASESLLSLDEEDVPTRAVFDALRLFTACAQATLVLMVGNHDIELALPEPRQVLLDLVASDSAALGRVRLVTDGSGYTCAIGGRRIVCVHGNERDDWNVIDHAALRRQIRDTNLGRRVAPWEPNAGTRLVIDVMNPVKRSLPFVDLLKPEDEAVPNILLALDKERRGLGVGQAVRHGIAIVHRKLVDARRIKSNVLGGDATDGVPEDDELDVAALREVDPGDRERLYEAVETAWEDDRVPMELVPQEQARLDAINTMALSMGIGVRSNLRSALRDIAIFDQGFDPSAPDPTFRALDSWVGRDVDVLIAGHTHLERHLVNTPNRPGGIYLNTGTWIRLIQLQPEFIEEPFFDDLLDALTAPSMAALDAASINGKKLVVRRRTVACIERTGDSVTAGLRHVRDDAVDREPFETGVPRPHSRFTVAHREAAR